MSFFKLSATVAAGRRVAPRVNSFASVISSPVARYMACQTTLVLALGSLLILPAVAADPRSRFVHGVRYVTNGGSDPKGPAITDLDRVTVSSAPPPRQDINEWMRLSGFNIPRMPTFFEGGSSENTGAPEQTTEPGCSSGNPVILATGNKVEPELDFAAGGEMGLYLSRTYNKQWSGRGIFGRNWLSNFDYSLAPQTTGGQNLLWLQHPDGRRIKFIWSAADGNWKEDKAQAVAYITRSGDGTYTHFNETNGTERYRADGYILELRNEQGVAWIFSYLGTLLQKVTHSSGREVSFTWTGKQVSAVTAPNTQTFAYTYTEDVFGEGHSRLASATSPGGPSSTTVYHYEDARFPDGLTGKTVNGRRYSWFTYHPDGRAASTEHAGGAERYTFSYAIEATQPITPPPAPPPPGGYDNDADRGWCEYIPGTGRICYMPTSTSPDPTVTTQNATAPAAATTPTRMRVTETNPLGKQTVYRYEERKLISVEGLGSQNCAARYNEKSYDINGYLDLASDFKDGLTDLDHDAQGHLLKQVEGVGSSVERTTTFTWDAAKKRVLKETIQGLLERSYSYDPAGRLTSVSTKNLSANGTSGQTITTTYSYTLHANGLVASITSDGPLPGAGDAITQQYSSQGDLISVRNSLNHTETFSMHNGLGLPGRTVGANGAVTDHVYDGLGRRRATRANVNGGVAETAYD